jgi:hypothetical protein
MKHTQPKAIGNAIESAIRYLGIGRKLKDYEVLEVWPDIVGEQISKVTTPLRIEHGKLFVHVTQAVWRNELVFLKSALIEKINTMMHQEIVNDIIFR